MQKIVVPFKLSRLKKRNSHIGYTLIEIMVAMFVFVILAAIVTSTLSQVLKVREENNEHMKRLEKLQMALMIIERDIQQMIRRPIINSIDRREEALETNIRNKNQIVFTRTGYVNPLAQIKRSTLQRVGYYLNGSRLIRQNWLAVDRNNDSLFGERILLNDVQSLKWRFADQENKFYDLWPPVTRMRDQLPRAIELTLELAQWGKVNRLFIIAGHTIDINYETN